MKKKNNYKLFPKLRKVLKSTCVKTFLTHQLEINPAKDTILKSHHTYFLGRILIAIPAFRIGSASLLIDSR